MTENHDAIRGIIERQFGSLTWTAVSSPDWSAFERDFLPGASLYPAARPAKSQKPEEFVERMKGLAATRLRSFKEVPLGHEIRVFGNVAIAVAVCEITENEAQVTRGVENDASRQERRVLANRFPSLGRAKRVEADTSGPSPNSVRGRRKPRPQSSQ